MGGVRQCEETDAMHRTQRQVNSLSFLSERGDKKTPTNNSVRQSRMILDAGALWASRDSRRQTGRAL